MPTQYNGCSKLQQLRPVYCSGDHYVNCMSPWFTPILLQLLSFNRSCPTVLHDRFSAGSPNLQLFLRWIIITSQYHYRYQYDQTFTNTSLKYRQTSPLRQFSAIGSRVAVRGCPQISVSINNVLLSQLGNWTYFELFWIFNTFLQTIAMPHIHIGWYLPLSRTMYLPARPTADVQRCQDKDEKEEQGGYRPGLSFLVSILLWRILLQLQ